MLRRCLVSPVGIGLSGQKCSALSKVYVARGIMDDFLGALVDTTNKLMVGDPRHKDVFMGPVIDEAARGRFSEASTDAAAAGSIVSGGAPLCGDQFDCGPYVTPTIVRGLKSTHRINRDELFVPFLSVLPLDDLNDAIEDSNASAFVTPASTQGQGRARPLLNAIEAGVLYARFAASGATTGAWPGSYFLRLKGSGTTGKGGLSAVTAPFMREQSPTCRRALAPWR